MNVMTVNISGGQKILMKTMIDITFNVYSDTPTGKDPDAFSPTLRKYHQTLWSKNLPNGSIFNLDDNTRSLLHHK